MNFSNENLGRENLPLSQRNTTKSRALLCAPDINTLPVRTAYPILVRRNHQFRNIHPLEAHVFGVDVLKKILLF